MLHQLQSQAVQAAKNQDWETAAAINQQIINENPEDIDAFNRLGIALVQLKKTKEAKKAFKTALKIDPKNNIAKKNLEKLKQHRLVTPHLNTGVTFVEEPGKTKIIKLHRLASKTVLENLSAGDICRLVVKKRYISVEVANQYVGSLPEDISFRLTKLINTGNRYECLIQKTSYNTCWVYLKEVKKSKRNINIHSFPINGSNANSNLDIRSEKEELQVKIPFEVVNLETEDDSTLKIETDSTVVT